MASGAGSQLAILRVGSFAGTSVVTPSAANGWRWTNFVSEGLVHEIEELIESAITGNRDEPPSHQGLTTAEGDIELEPNPNAIGVFLRGAFGTHVSSQVVAATSTGANSGTFAGVAGFRHVFTPREDAFSDLCFLDPHQIMVYRDVGSAWIFQDALFNGLTFNIEAAQLVRATASTMARRVTRASRSQASSLVNSGGRPWVWDMASVQIGLSAASLAGTDVFESMEIALETPIEGVPVLNGQRLYGEMQASGFRTVRVSGALSFRNQEEYDRFVAYENYYVRVTLTNVNSQILIGNPNTPNYFTLAFDIPAFKYTAYNVNVDGPDRMTADFEGRGERGSGGFTIQAVLTNIVNSY